MSAPKVAVFFTAEELDLLLNHLAANRYVGQLSKAKRDLWRAVFDKLLEAKSHD